MEQIGTILDIHNATIGKIERHAEYPTIQIIIRSNQQRFIKVGNFLTRALTANRPITAADGKLYLIAQLFTDKERYAIASKIESLSEGQLRVDYTVQTGDDSC